MMDSPFVPEDFAVPTHFTGSGFRLEPLGPEHNEPDYAAWTSSSEHIHATPGFEDSKWPHPMTLEENLDDLERHARDFANREGFTYTIRDGAEIIGCLYIYPSRGDDGDAAVSSWVTEDRSEMDAVVWREVSTWLADRWPFRNPVYAARE
jgi:hypothetical protein